MKKKICISFICAFIFGAVLAAPSYALNIGVGAISWFAWWSPVFEKSMQEYYAYGFGSFPSIQSQFTMNPNLLYGPVLSIGGERWTLNSVFVMGSYHAHASSIVFFGGPGVVEDNISIRKYDVDSTLNYIITENIKLFTGFKYQHYTYSLEYLIGGPTLATMRHFAVNGYGSGLGIAFTVPLHGNLYLLWNISAVYMAMDFKNNGNESLGSPGLSSPVSARNLVHSIGGNTTLNLAYYFESLSTTLSLGFRYQILHFFNASNGVINATVGGQKDQFYGVTLSVVYNFTL